MQAGLQDIIFPTTLSVTEQEIDIAGLTDRQKQFYIDLFNKIVNIYTTKQKERFIIGVSGPSGSGKSVIAILFKEIAKQLTLPFVVEAISIDAFHYPNHVLTATITGDGETLKARKGRFDTYDTVKLAKKLDTFLKGEMLSFPLYSRAIHDPVEDSIAVAAVRTLLIVEGLWLLNPAAGWKEVAACIDFNIFVTGNKEKAKELVVRRHVKGGRTAGEAALYFNNVDAVNFDLVMQGKDKADLIIPPFYEV